MLRPVCAMEVRPAADRVFRRSLLTVAMFLLCLVQVRLAAADLSISIYHGTPVISSKLNSHIVVSNLGPGLASSLVVTSEVPAGCQIVSAVASSGVLTQSEQRIACTLTGLASGARLVLSFATLPHHRDFHIWDAGVNSASADPNLNNNTVQSLFKPDSDGDLDGMADQYELDTNLNPFSKSDATTDPDGDGLTNLQEFYAGTKGKDTTSLLRTTPLLFSGADVIIRFPSVTNRLYRVEGFGALPGDSWTALVDYLPGSGGTLSVTNTGARSAPGRIYRVSVVP